jgi:hypothetical protein
MELLAVRTARFIAYLNAEELNPKGRPIAHDFFPKFVERYEFIKRPSTAEEILDPQNKGVIFEQGKLDDIGINKVTLFDTAVAIETSASTDASENVFYDILKWGAETFELSNRPDLVTRKSYVSELVFTSETSLPAINPGLQTLASRITELVGSYIGHSEPFEVTGITISFDPTQSKQLWTPFQVYRLAETPFSQNKYYSGAPLKTSDHIAIIEQFESLLKS